MMNLKSFDTLRNWIARQPATPKIRIARLHLFDLYRYREEYDKLYEFIKEIGGEIKDD